jgi:recyclin-1
MDKFATLEPVRLYTPSGKALAPTRKPLIGRLPVDLHELVLTYAAIPDIASYARTSRALAALSRSDDVWRVKWSALGVDTLGLSPVLDELEERTKNASSNRRMSVVPSSAPPTLKVDADDDFGDFAEPAALTPSADELGEFVGAFSGVSIVPAPLISIPTSSSSVHRTKFIRAHQLLRTCAEALAGPAHLVLTALFPPPAPTSLQQSTLLRLLARWLSPAVQPLHKWPTLRQALRAAADRFDAGVLAEFDFADTRGDEDAMRAAAHASWAVWDDEGGIKVWELGRVWAEKREIFYEQGRWRAAENVTCVRVTIFALYWPSHNGWDLTNEVGFSGLKVNSILGRWTSLYNAYSVHYGKMVLVLCVSSHRKRKSYSCLATRSRLTLHVSFPSYLYVDLH